jgi:hypothetical protein
MSLLMEGKPEPAAAERSELSWEAGRRQAAVALPVEGALKPR